MWPRECLSGANSASPARHDPVGLEVAGTYVRPGARLPVELTFGNQVGTAALEPRVQQHFPLRPWQPIAHERLAGSVAAHHRGHLEVVPGGPVGVHHHRAYPERFRHCLGDRIEQAGGVGLLPDQPGGIEQPAQAGDGGWVSMRHGRIGPRLSGEPGNWGVFYVFRRMRASIERFRTVLGTAVTVLTVVFACAGCAKSAESPVAMPGRAGAVAVAPDNYGTLWMTTPARAYRSQDGGHSWKTVAGSAGGGAIAFGEKHTYLYGALGARVGPFTGLVVRPFRPGSPTAGGRHLALLRDPSPVRAGRRGRPLALGQRRPVVGAAARRGSARQWGGSCRAATRHRSARHHLRCRRAGRAVEIDRLWRQLSTGPGRGLRHRGCDLDPARRGAAGRRRDPVCCAPATTARASPGCSANPASPRSRSTPETPKTPLPELPSGLLLRSDDGGVSWSR